MRESDNRDLKTRAARATQRENKIKWVDVEEFRLQLAAPIESIVSSLPSFCLSVLFLPLFHLACERGTTETPRLTVFFIAVENMVPLYRRRDKYRSAPGPVATTGLEGTGDPGDGKFSTVLFVYNLCFPESGRPETPFHRFGYVNSTEHGFCRPLCDALSCLNWPAFVRSRNRG